MKTYKLPSLIILFTIIALILAGCGTSRAEPATPTVDLAPLQTQDAIHTAAAFTVEAALTQSAEQLTPTVIIQSATVTIKEPATATPTSTATVMLQPSDTPAATLMPQPTDTPTRVPPSQTSIPEPYQCLLLHTSPQFRAILQKGEDFDAHWTLYNNGTETWLPAQVVYAFRNGFKMQKFDSSYSLPVQVKPLEKIELIVDMQAPSEPGQYTAYWVLKHNKEDFCWFSVDITVSE